MLLRFILISIIISFSYTTITAQDRLCKAYHNNGVLQSQGYRILGEKNGAWEYWNKDSVLIKEKKFKNGQIESLLSFNINGDVKTKITSANNMGFGLKSEFKNGIIVKRTWMLQQKVKFTSIGGYSGYLSTLIWAPTSHLSSWKYYLSLSRPSGKKLNINLPKFTFSKGGELKSVSVNNTIYSYNKNGQITSYSGPLDKSLELYKCSFQTYDGDVNVKKDHNTIDYYISIEDFVGTVTLQFKNNLPNGTWKNKYPNGKTWYVINFQEGFLEGNATVYYANGNKKLSANFKKDHANGIYKEWHSNGQLSIEGEILNGKMVGVWNFYTEDGGIQEHFTKFENSFDGELIEKDRKGNMKKTAFYSKGELHGVVTEYGYTGNLSTITHYTNGIETKKTRYNSTTGFISRLEGFGLLNIGYNVKGHPKFIGYSDDINNHSIFFNDTGSIERFFHKSSNSYQLIATYKEDTISTYKHVVGEENLDYKPYDFITEWPQEYVVMRGDSINGEPQGIWEFYHPTGDVWCAGEFDKGFLTGKWEIINLEGNKIHEENYQNGLKHGVEKTWNNAQELKFEKNFINGKLDGIQKGWYLDSDKIDRIETYKDGLIHGNQKYYDKFGYLKNDKNYNTGNVDGTQIIYYPQSEAVKWVSEYVTGKRDGVSIKYGEDGNKLNENKYSNDKLNGYSIVYDGVGNIIKKTLYDYGEQIEFEEKIEQCSCDAGDNVLRNPKYFPSVTSLADWQSILYYLDGEIQISKSIYDKGFFSQLQAGYDNRTSTAIDLISRKEISFEHIENPGLKYILNPCLKSNEFSKIPLNVFYDYPIVRLMGEDYDPKSFKGKPREYFDLGLKITGISLKEIVIKWYNQYGFSRDAKKELKIIFKEKDLAPDYDWNKFNIDELVAKIASNKKDFINLLFEKNFQVQSLDKVNFPKEYSKFNQSFSYFFGIDYKRISTDDIDELFNKILELHIGNNKLGIEFLKGLFTPINSSIDNVKSSQLTLTVSSFNYSHELSLSINGATDFCFTPSYLSSTKLSLEFSVAKLYYNSGSPVYYSEHIKKLNELEQENNITPTYHINVPHAKGNWTSGSDVNFDVSYLGLYIEGEYLLGKITVKKSNEWTVDDQRSFLKLFDDFLIDENNSEILSGVFLFRSKNY